MCGRPADISVFHCRRWSGSSGRTVALIHARCSTYKQADNLERQVGRLLEHVNATWLTVKLYKNIGSGLNENRKQFKKLLARLFAGENDRVIVEYKDRISRYGFQAFAAYYEGLSVSVEVLQDAEPKEFEQKLAARLSRRVQPGFTDDEEVAQDTVEDK